MPQIICVIPCYNEKNFIEELAIKSQKYVDLVIVADDNSSDDTVNLALKSGANVVCHKTNIRGVGKNTERGIREALRQCADIVITLDGDGQHNPDDIPRLIEPILSGEVDLVIGDRYTNYKTIPLYRRLGISIITYCYNLGAYYKVGDAQCGFRAYSRKFLEKLTIEEQGFAFIVESLVKCRALGLVIMGVPITCVYHKKHSDNSTINPIKQGIGTLLSLIKWRLKLEVFKR